MDKSSLVRVRGGVTAILVFQSGTPRWRLHTWTNVWHEIFAGFNFCDFCDSTIRKKSSRKKLFHAKTISAKIYLSRSLYNAKVRLCIFIQKRLFRLKTKLLNYKWNTKVLVLQQSNPLPALPRALQSFVFRTRQKINQLLLW